MTMWIVKASNNDRFTGSEYYIVRGYRRFLPALFDFLHMKLICEVKLIYKPKRGEHHT